MSFDNSRHIFDPGNDYLGVIMQQGRVQLDADWNDLVAQITRRLQAGTLDTVGRAVVPRETADGFLITAAGDDLSIGRGRIYVDGLLAENHGPVPDQWDPVLAELTGSAGLSYDEQPYYPNPPALPTGGPHLVYLDVWQREVTYLQQPELLEKAVGVDTTGRLQTVWQVKLLPNVGAISCSTAEAEIPGWPAATRPSSARLTTATGVVAGEPDPCRVPPGGGYQGQENQFYRVEIHAGGAAGTASFKWSRDNATVATRVLNINASRDRLVVESVKHDDVLRFADGDWVEVTDEWRELHGQAGELRRIKLGGGVDDASRTITLEKPLSAGLFPTNADGDTEAARHTRVRRWDQKGKVRRSDGTVFHDLDAASSTGAIPVPPAGVALLLEDGILVNFDLAAGGGGFKVQDYWTFAARTADASIEILNRAPPRGIHHHYARLALVTFPDGETDCRTLWPPECGGCCTVTIAPGEDIQAALDALPPDGGCVCLKTGVHQIPAAIEIRASRIILSGEGPGAIVRSDVATTLLQIGSAATQVRDVVVEGIRFEAMAPAEAGIVWQLENCLRVRLAHCQVEAVPLTPVALPPYYAAVTVDNAGSIVIAANAFSNVMRGITISNSARVEVRGNGLTAPVLNLAATQLPLGEFGIVVQADSERPCTIDSNRFQNFWTAVSIDSGADGSTITGNQIRRSAVPAEGSVPGTAEALRQYLDARYFAIDVDAPGCVVRDNDIDLTSAFWAGVRASAAHVTIQENRFDSSVAATAPTVLLPAAIYCRLNADGAVAADHAVVRGNRLTGAQVGIILSRVNTATVAGNHIDGAGSGWFGIRVDDCAASHIDANDIDDVLFGIYISDGADNRITGNRIRRGAFGIAGSDEARLAICNNTVDSAPSGGVILLGATGPISVVANRIANCGYSPPAGLGAFGLIAVWYEFLVPVATGLRIEGCEILDTGISADGSQNAAGAALGILAWVPACQLLNNRITYGDAGGLDPQQQHRAMRLLGPVALRFQLGAGVIEFLFGEALVTGNTLRGPGRHNLVECQRLAVNDNIDFRFEKITFSNNVCEHLNAEASAAEATVRLLGGRLIAIGNHVEGPPGVNAMSLANRNHVALLGNVTTGDYINVGTVTPTPHTSFNVRV
jgi:parallel beta-helix repeat protein